MTFMKTRRWYYFISFFLAAVFIISACQPFLHTSVSEPTASPQNLNTTNSSPVSPTQAPTKTNTSVPTPEPTLEPTPRPFSFAWRDVPATLIEKVNLPEGAYWAEGDEEASYTISPYDGNQDSDEQAQTQWTYVLLAPFFTVKDDISLSDFIKMLNETPQEDEEQANPGVFVYEEDFEAVEYLLKLKNAKNLRLIKGTRTKLEAEPFSNHWLIAPFELLRPEWKVIAIDGMSPLDHDFDPHQYALTLHVHIDDGLEESEKKLSLEGILPPPNRKPERLTSLIMTGVTAMARDTAYIMETEGVLFPGTEIRGFMRAADLTHISNEVSFYEDCPFPDPDYEGFIFCSNPEYIKLLDDLGADVIELTGNHNNDVYALYKVDAVPFNKALYKKYGMRWYAGGTDIYEAKKPLLIEHNGNRLAFIGCNSYGPDMAWAKEGRSGAAPCEDFGWLKDEVIRLRGEGYIPIVTFQFQEDYVREATSLQLRDFRDVASAKPAIINGSQSHVGKAMEFYQDSFIHYGLGNLFFDQPDFYITYDSFIQEHYFFEGQHVNTRLHTITIEETGKPRPMTLEERQNFLDMIFSLSEPLRRVP